VFPQILSLRWQKFAAGILNIGYFLWSLPSPSGYHTPGTEILQANEAVSKNSGMRPQKRTMNQTLALFEGNLDHQQDVD
jgi:hypothetical protein